MENFKDLTREERAAALKALGLPAFREAQIFKWICKGAEDFSGMSDLSAELRTRLAEKWSLETLSVDLVQSSSDGTKKFLLGLPDGNKIETVFMEYSYGNSLCISTQVGCAMGCSFCASTIGGKRRNLKAWEMLDEFIVSEKAAGKPVNHLVLMGIGEPFDNYENLCEFLRQIHDPKGIGLSYRNITVSTCGIVPKIRQFGQDFPQVNLAISLHAANQKAREALMPVAKAYDLKSLLEAADDHGKQTGRRVTYEYTLIAGKNDSLEGAAELAELLRGTLCHVNLIPLNPVAETGLSASSKKQALAFADYLEKHGVPCSIRRTLGKDIDAACGQLRKKNS
jgi:23S rRNA (adenine2503-C2)-methyltransferase